MARLPPPLLPLPGRFHSPRPFLTSAEAEVGECSRRLANLTYVLWVCAYFLLIFILLEAVHLFFQPPAAGLVSAWNRNQLALFLAVRCAASPHFPSLFLFSFSLLSIFGRESSRH
jgi:hypothetical protein